MFRPLLGIGLSYPFPNLHASDWIGSPARGLHALHFFASLSHLCASSIFSRLESIAAPPT